MLLHVPKVLTEAQVARCRELMERAAWVDGRVTAGHQSAKAKDNLQIPEGSAEARDHLAAAGLDRTYPTVANLVRILLEKGFLEQVTAGRPFRYRPVRSYEDVSGRLLGDLLQRVFRGSRERKPIQRGQ